MHDIQVLIDNYEDDEGWLSAKVIEGIKPLRHLAKSCINGKVLPEQVMKAIETLDLELVTSSSSFFPTYESHVFICTAEPDDGGKPFVILDKGSGTLNINVYHMVRDKAHDLLDKIKDQFDPKQPTPNSVNFAFWQADPDDGCEVQQNRLKCPDIDSIKSNYTPKVFDEVVRIAELEQPFRHGKIILWHGPPGNGKTYMIRAFARMMATRHNITPEVIIDPENLFSTPKYLTSLLLRRPPGRSKQPFRLFIAEDCAQLFASDCRNHEGFSRLLNTADGLIGQGQKLIFLFTANEKIDEIDPAILRPGRCLQNLEVGNWTKERAARWLASMGREDLISKLQPNTSLAEMYALINDIQTAKTHKDSKIGF